MTTTGTNLSSLQRNTSALSLGQQRDSLDNSRTEQMSPSNSISSLQFWQGSAAAKAVPQDPKERFAESKQSFKNKMKAFFKKNEAKKQRIAQRRSFYINDRERNSLRPQFEPNYIRTTKYTFYNFLPLSLMYQFKRLPNFYFLIQAILNSIPLVSALNPITAYLPLGFVLAVSMVREGVEDWYRYKSDNETNKMPVRVVLNGTIIETEAKDLKVGDIVVTYADEVFPADLVVIASSNPDASCYIQTSSLDGEKALKTRKVPKFFDKILPSGGDQFQPDELISGGICEAEGPHGNLYQFRGRFKIGRKTYNLEHEQMLLKGTQLRNTKWVVGLVVYTGKETRIMMNSQLGSVKMSDMERMMNRSTVIIVTAMIGMTMILALLGGFWHSQASEVYETADNHENSVHFYLEFGYSSMIESFFTFVRYFQLLTLFLPTSLFVSVEFLKVFIAYYMMSDWRMMSKERGRGVTVKNMSIVEDLGQIHYIFTDKTGTLTRNQMEFHSMCVGSEIFSPKEVPFDQRKFEDCMLGRYEPNKVNLRLFSQDSSVQMTFMTYQDLLTEFMVAMSLTHDCLAVEKNGKRIYQGQSPDEITLVEFANKNGFEFVTSTDTWALVKQHWTVMNKSAQPSDSRCSYQDDITIQNSQMISLNNHETITEVNLMEFDRSNPSIKHPKRLENEAEQIFEVGCRMEFSSDRKRQSILVRDPRDERYKLYVKGADSEIKKRLKAGEQNPNIVSQVEKFVGEASERGLRTLLYAMKVLDEDEVTNFQIDLENAQENLEKMDERVQEIYSQLERNLTLIGATAVEDSLQEHVPEVINDLHESGIKVWMLTGDQFNTAENIGRSCQLIKSDFEIYRIRTREQVEQFCTEEFARKNELLMKQKKKRALIIEATALTLLTERLDLEINFIRISKSCEAVICCRVSPKQKADVVRMIKKDDRNAITLAVGDGANDVSMINEAHVGIGLYGNEGLRAVQSSDFAIPEFQMLRRLILVHGRARYLSVSQFILYFFYKNCVVTMPQFIFAYYSGFSAMTLFDDFYINLYNAFFTCLPPLALGIFYWDIMPDCDEQILMPVQWDDGYDMSLSSKNQEARPKIYQLLTKLYYVGQLRKSFNIKAFMYMQAQGMFDATIVFYICFFSMQFRGGYVMNSSNGQTADLWATSVTAFTALIFVIFNNLFLRLRYIQWVHWLTITWGGILLYILYIWLANYPNYSLTQYAVYEVHRSLTFYMAIMCCIGICFAVDYGFEAYRVVVRQTPTDYLRQKIYARQPLDDKSFAYFMELVDREEERASKKLNQERNVVDLRRKEFLKLRRASMEKKTAKRIADKQTKRTKDIIISQVSPQPTPDIEEEKKGDFVHSIIIMPHDLNRDKGIETPLTVNTVNHSFHQKSVRTPQNEKHVGIAGSLPLQSDSEMAASGSDMDEVHRDLMGIEKLSQTRVTERFTNRTLQSPHEGGIEQYVNDRASHSQSQQNPLQSKSNFKGQEFFTIDESIYEEDGKVEPENDVIVENCDSIQSIELKPQQLEDHMSIEQVSEQIEQLSMKNKAHRHNQPILNVDSDSEVQNIGLSKKFMKGGSRDEQMPESPSINESEILTNQQPSPLKENNFIRESYELPVDTMSNLELKQQHTEVIQGNVTDNERAEIAMDASHNARFIQ